MKVKVSCHEYYPVFEIRPLEPGEQEDQFTVTLTSKEVAHIRQARNTWERHQEKLRAVHPWF